MKLVNDKLYITIAEAVECGIASEKYLWKAKSERTACWCFIDDPADRRKVLIGYEELNDERKRKVNVRFGNPYDRVARKPILDMVVNDWQANDYYMSYRISNSGVISAPGNNAEMSLPINRVNQYTRAASWLNMINMVIDDKRIIKNHLGITYIPDFYAHVAALVSLEKDRGKMTGYAGMDVLPGDFPSSYQRLTTKARSYKEAGYDSLIEPMYGNKNASKLGKSLTPALSNGEGGSTGMGLITGGNDLPVVYKTPEITPKPAENGTKNANKRGAFDPELAQKQMRVIRALCEKAQNLDAGQVAEMVESIFMANGWKPLSRARINDIINENMHLLTAGREGKRSYMTKIAMQVKRQRPDMPLKYWTLDGWTAELLYQERGKKGVEYKRLVVVVVLDAYNNYPIGYAIGERETPELIREANRNAMVHVQQLFGEYYRPWQVQSDHYSIKNLTPFYQAMTHLHTPAAVGNAKAKVVEPYFKDLNKGYCQKLGNWSGFNVTARKQVNTEYLNKVKSSFPNKEGVTQQITNIMEHERRMKVAEYTSQWARYEANGGMPEILNETDWLMVFGRPLGDRTNKLTGEGIVKQVDGAQYVYDSFDPSFRANRHINWALLGEPEDMSRVLAISPDGKMKFLLREKRVLPMDVRSMTPEDHAYLADTNRYNKAQVDHITELYGSDADAAYEVISNTPFDLSSEQELAFKAMFITNGQQKDAIQDAKGLRKVQRTEERRIAQAAAQEAANWDLEREQWLNSEYYQ